MKIRPTGSVPSKLYGLPKIHKTGNPLRPIISQIGSYTYDLAKFLVPILAPLAKNDYTTKDSFTFVQELRSLDKISFMCSFDVVSLFTNIPLEETVEICLDKLYANSETVHNLCRQDLKKLIMFVAKENYFLFDNKYFDQIDGVSMGSPIGPVLANIFMCHLEEGALHTFPGSGPIMYKRFVDDCFLTFENKQQSEEFFNHMNKQHGNITFTKEDEHDNCLPFLDILISRDPDGTTTTSIYRKPTYSGLYLKWESFVPKQFKTGLVKCLLDRAWRLCSDQILFNNEVTFIKKILAANGYPFKFLNSCVKKFVTQKELYNTETPVFGPKKKEIMIKLPFKGKQSHVIRRQLCRLYAAVAPWIKVTVIFHAPDKLSKLSKLKCVLPSLKQSGLIYRILCIDCNEFYIGMTKRRLQTRVNEHKKDEYSALCRHSLETGHNIDYYSPDILAKDSNLYRLQVKETLKIQENFAYKSLNGNTGSLMLKLW